MQYLLRPEQLQHYCCKAPKTVHTKQKSAMENFFPPYNRPVMAAPFANFILYCYQKSAEWPVVLGRSQVQNPDLSRAARSAYQVRKMGVASY